VYVNVLARLFSGKMLAMLADAHDAGQLKFFNTQAGLADKKAFKRFLAPLRRIKWVAYCKAPFAGPKQVLRYLSRYTHRVAISNRRLVAADDAGVACHWKDYHRIDGPSREEGAASHARVHPALSFAHAAQGLPPHPPLRALRQRQPRRQHRDGPRPPRCRPARRLPQQQPDIAPEAPRVLLCPCLPCGGRMIVIEVFASGCEPRRRPTPGRSDTS
jgi:hypothetical protein